MRDLKREIKSQQSNLPASPNGSGGAECNYGQRASALDVCFYEQQWHVPAAGRHAAATPRAAQQADVEYAAQLSPEATDDEEKAELELTLAVGSGAKKRYSNEHGSPGESFSSSSTESDTLTGGREWHAHNQVVATGSPYHKRRPARFEVVQVEDGAVQQQQQPSPLLFHWLSLRMA